MVPIVNEHYLFVNKIDKYENFQNKNSYFIQNPNQKVFNLMKVFIFIR